MIRKILLLLTVLLVAGCSDETREPYPPQPPMISDVGEIVQYREWEGVLVVTYQYDGVRFEGDLEMEDWDSIQYYLFGEKKKGWTVMDVTNYLVFPDPYREKGVFVRVCASAYVESCLGGQWFSFRKTEDGMWNQASGTW